MKGITWLGTATLVFLAGCGGDPVAPGSPGPGPDPDPGPGPTTPPVTVSITTTELGIAVEGAGHADTLVASGGDGAFVWSILSGALPAGLSLTASGVIEGTPTEWGSFSVQVGVASGGASANRLLSIGVMRPNRLSAGGSHTCALQAGSAFCWGRNDAGELDGTGTGNETTPVPASAHQDFALVTAGGGHSCGVRVTGEAVCWGVNFSGTLGNSNLVAKSPPVPVEGGRAFIALSAGYEHTCGLSVPGEVHCWGVGTQGQIGDGSTSSGYQARRVAGAEAFAEVSAGYQHSCALTVAGQAYCWGQNDLGQLGDGTQVSSPTPVAVSGSHVFVSISAGFAHTCAVDTSGDAYCWGDNAYGQLGTGSNVPGVEPSPVQVSGGLQFTMVSAGWTHSCGLGTAGEVSCWGLNGNGQVGNGSPDTMVFTPAPVSGGLSAVELATNPSSSHTCLLTTAGEVFCWGWNQNGRLGDGTTTDRNVPTGPVVFP